METTLLVAFGAALLLIGYLVDRRARRIREDLVVPADRGRTSTTDPAKLDPRSTLGMNAHLATYPAGDSVGGGDSTN